LETATEEGTGMGIDEGTGEHAYIIYMRAVNYRDEEGNAFPAYADLPGHVKAAWEKVARTLFEVSVAHVEQVLTKSVKRIIERY
jgi:hypothetical protein